MAPPTPLGRTNGTMKMTLRSFMARRSSVGVPISTLIFPRSAADRSDAKRLAQVMENKYGFHFVTNSFTRSPVVELDFQAFYTETNLTPALWTSGMGWFVWLVICLPDWVSYYSHDRDVSALRLWLSLLILIPVPLLALCCRCPSFRGQEQTLLCLIAHCFAAGILGHGFIKADDYARHYVNELHMLLSLAFNETLPTDDASSSSSSHAVASTASSTHKTTPIVLDGSTKWWIYATLEASGHDLILAYINRVVFPINHLNMNMLRPLVVLLGAPMLRLDAFHYLLLTFTVCLEFSILVALQYPASSSSAFVMNKFVFVFTLVAMAGMLALRVRETDRFLRLNFLHAKIVEEGARATHLQKEIIINENKSLKKMLEQRVRGPREGDPPLDFDSPMAKVLLDLKALQRATQLSPDLRANLDGILTLLMRKGQNLFAPDIHEQLKLKREGDMDGDIKTWASTALENKSYTRNPRAATVFQSIHSSSSSSREASRGSTGLDVAMEDAAAELHTHETTTQFHPDVTAPSDDILNAVSDMMERDGWNLDTFEVARLTNQKPISFVTYIAFEQHNLFELCAVNKGTLANYLHFLDTGYHRNPYHNNCHAADVVGSVEYLIAVMDNGYLQDVFTYQEVFAALIAAAIHDFRHPGKNNNFLIQSASDLAIQFSDSSVLERMHLAEAFFLAKGSLCNIFAGLLPAQYSDVRKAIIEMVLATDLTVHLQLVGSLKTALISQVDTEVEHSPMLLMKIVIKCADVGHSSKTLKLHARWSDLIIEEFFLQGDEEQTRGMEISPFMNRKSENSARNQVGFFEFIVLPFFEVVAEAVFRVEFKTIVDQAHQNYKLWKKAETMQINSIKDILDQILAPKPATVSTATASTC